MNQLKFTHTALAISVTAVTAGCKSSGVVVDNRHSFGIGTYTNNVKLPNGKRMDVPGKWVSVLRRVGSSWKIFAHCWNEDLPVSTLTT